jgi:hypothetical protein
LVRLESVSVLSLEGLLRRVGFRVLMHEGGNGDGVTFEERDALLEHGFLAGSLLKRLLRPKLRPC